MLRPSGMLARMDATRASSLHWLTYTTHVAFWLCATSAGAQTSGDMGQGEASIAVRSDVKLSVKGTGGTPSERLSKLGQAATDQLGEIRGCYRKLVDKSPEITGGLKLKVVLEQGKNPAVEMLNQTGSADPLVVCVTQVLERAKYAEVGRPAAAIVTLEFDNSRARGQSVMVERAAQIARTPVSTNAAGQHEVTWSTSGQEVRFSAAADSSVPDEQLQLVMQGFMRDYAAFLDCRRKCEQGGVSPEGDIDAHLTVDAKGQAKVALGTITVKHKRASGCVDRAFKRVTFAKPAAAPLQTEVRVHFAR